MRTLATLALLSSSLAFGQQPPTHERDEFRSFLEVLGYPACSEVGNPAYDAFLTGGTASRGSDE